MAAALVWVKAVLREKESWGAEVGKVLGGTMSCQQMWLLSLVGAEPWQGAVAEPGGLLRVTRAGRVGGSPALPSGWNRKG